MNLGSTFAFIEQWKYLRVSLNTDLMLIITSTADELSGGANIDDLERSRTPKIGFLVKFSRF